MPRCLLASLLLLSACTEQQGYQATRAAARLQPATGPVGPGLRFGMGRDQVERHLDSLRRRDELVWHGRLYTLPTHLEAQYVDGRLARLTQLVVADGQPGSAVHEELHHGLEEAYGGVGYSPDEEPSANRSWFRGGTEVDLVPWPRLGFELTYTDLHQTGQLSLEHPLPTPADSTQ